MVFGAGVGTSQGKRGEKAAFSGHLSQKAEPFAAPICHLQL